MALIPEEQLEQIRERVDIVEYISQRVALKKAGQNFKGLCPFHNEKTPSFTVNPVKQIYHCFGCGEGGNIFRFIMHFDGLDFVEAADRLANLAGIRLQKSDTANTESYRLKKQLGKLNRLAAEFYFNQLYQEGPGRKAQAYLEERQIQRSTAQHYLLGYAPDSGRVLVRYLQGRKVPRDLIVKAGLARRGGGGELFDFFRDRLIFPIRNSAGEFIGFGGRILSSGGPQQPKYLNTPETPIYHKGREVYGLYEARHALRETRQAFLVEGYMDVIALAQHGLEQSLAPLGTALTSEQVQRIRRQAQELYLIFDGDEAGQKAAWRALETILSSESSARMVALPPEHDPDSYVRTVGPAVFTQQILAAPGLMDYFMDKLVAENPQDNLGKVAVVKRLLPQLARVSGEVEKALYIQRLATKLGLPEATVKQELLVWGKRSRNFQKKVADDIDAKRHAQKVVRFTPFERDLLRALLSKEEGVSALRQEVRPRDWHHPELVARWPELSGVLEQGLSAVQLIEFFSGSVQQELSALLVEMTADESLEDLVNSCRQQLRRKHLELRRQELTQQIHQAESAQDEERMTALMLEKNSLLKELESGNYR